MKKASIIIGIIVVVIIFLIAIKIANYKITENRIEKISNDSEIYIIYQAISEPMTPTKGKYAYIDLNAKKIYVIKWKKDGFENSGLIIDSLKNSLNIETKKISDEEISKLLNMIDKAKTEKANNNNEKKQNVIDPKNMKSSYHVKYKDEQLILDSLPFSY